MRKSFKRLIFKTNLLISLCGLFAVTCLGQNEQTTKCRGDYYYCKSAEYLKIVASECQGEKGVDCGIAQYTKMIESNPNDAVAYFQRGFLFFIKETDWAIRDFSKALELDPKYERAYNMLGLSYDRKGEHEKAILVFSNAINLFPKSAYQHYASRGGVYYRQRNFDKALADYNKAIELASNYEAAYSGRANVYASQHDFDKALTDYSKAIEINPDFWVNHHNRGYLYLKLGEKAKSEADLQKAKELKELEEKQ